MAQDDRLSQLSDDQLLQLAKQQGIDPTSLPNWNESGVDRSQGLDAGNRALMSFKSDPQERINFLRKMLGEDNVTTTQGGEIVWKNPKTGRWTAVDEAGFSMADIADFAGDLPEMILSGAGAVAGGVGGGLAGAPAGPAGIIGGVIGGGKLGAGLGAAGGNVIKQLASAALVPGEESARLGERAADVGEAAALGWASQGVANVAGKLIRGGRAVTEGAPNAVGKFARSSNDPELLKRGLELEERIGGQLLPSQLTGNRIYALLEGYYKRNPIAAETFDDFVIQQQMQPLRAHAERVMNQLLDQPVGDELMGQSLRRAMEESIDRALTKTSRDAARDFGLLKGLGKKEPRIVLDNYIRGLNMLIRHYSRHEIMGDQGARIAKEAMKMRDALIAKHTLMGGGTSRAGVAVPPQTLKEMLEARGRAAFGKETSVFQSLSENKSLQREIEQELHSLLKYDLEIAAIANPGVGSKLLNAARVNYERNMSNARGLQSSMLARYLGNKGPQFGGERVADWVLNLKPSELQATIQMLEPTEPLIRSMLQRVVIERAVAAGDIAAETATRRLGVKAGRFNFDAFVKSMPGPEQAKILFGETSEQIARDLDDLIEFAERAGAIGAAGTIQTPLHRLAQRLVERPTLSRIMEFIAPQQLTKVLISKELRKPMLGALKEPTEKNRKVFEDALERLIQPLIYETMRSGVDQRANIAEVQ